YSCGAASPARGAILSDLSTDYVGLHLTNPIIVAPAAITETAERMKRCEDAGAAAVVVKTYFETEVSRRAPAPRFEVIRYRSGRERAFTLYSYEQASIFDRDEYAEEIRRAKECLSIPVIASINCVTDDEWVRATQACQQAGADALELNVSCPHGSHVMSDTDIATEMVRCLSLVKGTARIPIVPKMTPQLTSPVQTAQRLAHDGASAVVMFNRFTGLDVDVETALPRMHGSYAGHGGPWSIHYVLRWIAETSPRLSIPIAASGGVTTHEDVVKLLLVGAQVVETCTAVVMRGYQAITELVEGVQQYMDAHGYRALHELRGKTCGKILGLDEVDRSFRTIARIDAERCIRCGTCYRVCIYDAVCEGDEYSVIPEACDGCGLCAVLCPASSIEMVPRPPGLPYPRKSVPTGWLKRAGP
ncbi:MAG: 4Fe-4S binding protein, partial [Armatimonadota bacterium]